ncbi:F0F1 ATP synthase subunit epsilon [Agriterribacter sp.]|uniref:F0F1 ATP synthase subunit epsilon n=1 Tax=Agriterribacter sp. TaxID=2821509 RepID=UPI002CF785A5|nr:F0F1 ATP synthase subunit epsilon [Agriterribacter sp.]HRP57285.1 F0F1 ATP synthase subunit epsilon [Agriterribacter sp.]
MADELQLKILLPHAIFLEKGGVVNVQVETTAGAYGFLPQRLDCMASVAPGLLTYITADGKEYHVAVDRGLLVKAGKTISLVVRNAIGGSDLGELHKSINEKFRKLDDLEQESRRVMSYLETGFIRNFEKLATD